MDRVIIFVAQYLIIAVPLVLLQVLWTLSPKDRARFAVLAIFSLALAYIFAKIGTHLIDSPRPFEIGNFTPLVPHGIENGFPSMHTLFAVTSTFDPSGDTCTL
jgi:membrane-associated phospholipid phosphatase